jgi:hypothetical protein
VDFIPTTALPAGQQLTLTVKGSVESYADVQMGEDFQQAFDIEATVEELRADSVIHVIYDQGYEMVINALPAAAAAGKKVSVKVISDMIATTDNNEVTLDANGQGSVIVTGEAHGTTAIVLQMTDDTDITKTVMVNVKEESDFVCPMPTANYQVGMELPYGSLIELSCEVPEATIYYTLDGTCPCAEGSSSVKKYVEPIPLTSDLTIKAFAKAPGYADSEIVELSFLVTAIRTVTFEVKRPAATYTLSGLKVEDGKKLPKGIYIHDGKKVVIK